MYSLNKIIGYLANPVTLAGLGVLLAFVLRIVGWRRLAGGLLILCVAWMWLWATPFMTQMVGVPLERDCLVNGRVPVVGSYTNAAVIVLHGGSMGDDSKIGGCGEMWTSADRVWMAARLWKAGKAPVIYVTGDEVAKTTAGLLEDLGVPTNAVVYAEGPRNTEEEARFVADAMKQVKVEGQGQVRKSRVLAVTSSWHMKRTMMLYAKCAPDVEVVPVPCDFENTLRTSACTSKLALFLPNADALQVNVVAFHEWIGILGYRIKWLVVGD